MLEEIVNKGGERWLEIGFRHGHYGLEATIKTHPRVEDFVKALGSGEKHRLGEYGIWYVPENEHGRPVGPELAVWDYDKSVESEDFSLDNGLGRALVLVTNEKGGSSTAKPNMSFLRLVGISNAEGVTFGVKGMRSLGDMRKAKDLIGKAFRDFVLNYIVQSKLTMIISSQEIQG